MSEDMEFRKLRQLDSESGGVTLPKEQLREAGLLDERGRVDGGCYVRIEQTDDAEWKIRAVGE
jgi:hypothetical protein